MANGYRNVLELARATISDKFARKLHTYARRRSLSSSLCVFRCSKGLTQKQLAKNMGITEARVARCEDGTDSGVTISYLNRYANAFDMKVTILLDSKEISEEQTVAVHAIKQHVFQIHHQLSKLTNLAEDDGVIQKGVDNFHQEYLYNILRLFIGNYHKLQGQEIEKDELAKLTESIHETIMETMELNDSETPQELEQPSPVLLTAKRPQLAVSG